MSLIVAMACSSGGSGGSGNPIAPGPQPPNTAPEVTLSGDANVNAGSPITLTIQATDADGVTRIVISWGDGTADTLQVAGATSHQAPVTHTYGRVGVFHIVATATDSRSATGTAFRSVTAVGGALEIGLEHAPGSAHLIARARVSVSPDFVSHVRDNNVITALNLVPGEHQVTAEVVTPNCVLDGEAVRTVQIQALAIAQIGFSITCVFDAMSRIAFQHEPAGFGTSNIWTIRPDGTDLKQLTTHGFDQFADFSPDGTRIAFQGQSDFTWIMNFDGSALTPLTTIAASRPRWSPDGARVVFHTEHVASPKIAVVNANGSNLVLLTNGGEQDRAPAWSPDGTQIAFSRDGVIHLMNADGSELRALPANGAAPAWSPDRSKLVFVSTGPNADQPAQIWQINTDGSSLMRLSNVAPDCGGPTYRRNGTEIIMHCPRGGGNERIWRMNADGSNPRLVDGIPQPSAHAIWWDP